MSVSISHLNYTYARTELRALADFHLQVAPGEFVVLAGPSGCGKTTAARLINGLIPHFYDGELRGQVLVNGRDPAEREVWDSAGEVGSVFQNPRSQFFTTDPVSEIAFGCENLGFPAELTRERVASALRDFDFEHLSKRSIFALSGGEKQRLACASVAAIDPSIYVLDEPSANLDGPAAQRLHDIMAEWKRQGKAIVVAEHRLNYLYDLVDRLIVLANGRIVREYSGERLRSLSSAELSAHGLRQITTPILHPSSPASASPKPGFSRPASSPPASLTVKNLVYRHKRRGAPGAGFLQNPPAVNIDNLSFPKGKITALIGSNGAGKTTLVRWMAGLIESGRGQLLDEGEKISGRRRRRQTFLVLQDVNHQLVTESVRDEIDVTLRLSGADGNLSDTRDAILQKVDLFKLAGRHPMSLSGGQKQRLAIGTALASGREIIILDEPTSGLDLVHMRAVAAALKELTQAGRTVIVVTHDSELAALCADSIVKLHNGQVVTVGPGAPAPNTIAESDVTTETDATSSSDTALVSDTAGPGVTASGNAPSN
ncbi:MAG: ABC transporter ATP-binding protein [Ancrocorticia sp.]